MAPGIYATLDDVQGRMPQFPLTPTTRPSLEQAQIFLNDIHAEVNGALENMGYKLPILGPKSIPQVRALICDGAIARILYARGAGIGGEGSVTSADRHQKLYDDKLKQWGDAKNPKELVDAERTGDQVAKPDASLAGSVFDDEGNKFEPRATMDQLF